MRWMIAAVAATVLAGCATGIQPGGEYPSQTFTVPLSYQEAYRRADAQARECAHNMAVTGELFTDNQTGVVRVNAPTLSADLLRVSLRAVSESATEATVTASNEGQFDGGQVIAMRQSIETGTPVCR